MANTLRFSRALYLEDAVQAAVEAYAEVGSFELSSSEHEITVSIEADPRYGDRIVDAFCNHALFETIVRSREQLGGVLQ